MREKRQNERRIQILEAAIKIFGQEGFYDAKIESIAATAGIAKGTIYQYYGSKEELIQASLDFMVDRFEDKYIEGSKEMDSAIDRLKWLIHISVMQFYELQPLLNFNLMASLLHDPKQQEKVKQRHHNWNNHMEELLTLGYRRMELRKLDTEVFTSTLFGAIFQLCHPWSHELLSLEKARSIEKSLTELMLHGIAEVQA